MCNIKVGRYTHPSVREFWQGWVEPEDNSWIIFIDRQGNPVIYLDRDPETGAVLN